MSSVPSSVASDTEDLVLQFGELRITLRGSQQVTVGEDRTVVISSPPRSNRGALAGRSGPEVSAPSSRSSTTTSARWVTVEGLTESFAWTAEWENSILSCYSSADFEAADLTPVLHLARRLQTVGDGWTGKARVGRALRAGLTARQVLDGHLGVPLHTPALPNALAERVYVVLRAAPGSEPGWTNTASLYFAAVLGADSDFHPRSISHSFASRAEAEAYLIGARTVWPPQYLRPARR